MPIEHIILILFTGIVAGFINVLAGGGSLLTMPVLIFLGLPSATANGTNRIALMVQNIVAISNFKRKGFLDWHLNLMLAVPAVLGSIIGANIAVSLPDEIFNKILGVIMLVVLGLILFKTRTKEQTFQPEMTFKRKVLAIVAFFFIGIYGGFIQAGIGFIIIAVLTWITGMSLININSIKVFIVAVYMVFSLFVFIINGHIDWILGFVLAAGNGIGGWLGSNFAIARGDRWIRIILLVAVTAMAAKLLGVFTILGI